MSVLAQVTTAHEQRVARRLEARGLGGLGAVLVRLRGVEFGGRHRFESLYAVGAEGAVFLAREGGNPGAPLRVAKIPLLPVHRPIDLHTRDMRARREGLREEARHLAGSASPYMPVPLGLYEFRNPLLDPARGEEFAAPEPVLLMERLPGFDLDVWLARMHRSDVPPVAFRRSLDHVAVVLLQALWDLQERGYVYADLRPGNIRIFGRPARRIRLLDAGSLVLREETSGRFPHVPAYLPPDLFQRVLLDEAPLVPSPRVQAVMAGRTLFEAATGTVPLPGQQVDPARLRDCQVSQQVADTIDGLCSGSFTDVLQALKYLSKRATRRIPTAPPAAPAHTMNGHAAHPPAPQRPVWAADPVAPPPAAPASPPSPRAASILPPPRRVPWWRRLFRRS